ncbi:MAG TPA: outer membrane protein assembly factor BamD [Candidatus Eisenbacteria bacterium]|nr:outer membrane protein assembly factor BamD [Candidatus Eisenbacteria bacterium]
MSLRTLVVAVVLVAGALGCAGKKPTLPADELWTEANEAFEDEAYDYAVQKYKALLDQYPFDAHAEEAELKIAQAYYQADRYPEAIAAFGNFERMHPTSPFLPSVEYYRGLSYMAQYTTADRDQQAIKNALTSFHNIVDRFPNTPWAERANIRIRECREALARHEAEVATYYLRRKSIRAAESRLRGLLTEYPETDATADVLATFGAAYTDREETEGAKLAYETILQLRPQGPLGEEARKELGSDPPPTDEALPKLVAFIDSSRVRPDRVAVPKAVSAYPDTGNTTGQRY